MAKRGEGKAPMEAADSKVGTYIAYDKKGVEFWRREGFRAGRDTIPAGISLSMGAMQIVDPASGVVLGKWNPWNVI